MAHRETNSFFLTPDRKPLPDSATKRLATTADREIFKKMDSQRSPSFATTDLNNKVFKAQESNGEKRSRLQERVDELRAYLNETPKIEKRKIREIFDWNDKVDPEYCEEKRLLKELGSKVRGLIKQNSKLKHTIYTGEIHELRLENQRLKSLLETIHQGESVRNKIILEENQLLKSYIESSGKRETHGARTIFRASNASNEKGQEKKQPQQVSDIRQVSKQAEIKQEVEELEPKEPLFNENLLSLQRIQNLKNYFTYYVNSKIEENEEKLAAQQKYIDTLQSRIAQLQKIDIKLEHLKFQKKVKLQQSGRKSKNFTANAPNVLGQTLQNEVQQSIDQNEQQKKKAQLVRPINYYIKRERITQNLGPDYQLEKQLYRLTDENAILRVNYQDLKDKYEIEIQKHISDISEREKLLIQIERLNGQNKFLKEELYRLRAR